MRIKLFFLLLFSIPLFADSISGDIATASDYSGDCSGVANWALTQKPVIVNNDYYLANQVGLSQDMRATWYLGKNGDFAADSSNQVTADSNCLNAADIQKKVDDGVKYYTDILASKTNPLITEIKADSVAASSATTNSMKLTNEFALKSDNAATNDFFGDFLAEIREPYGAAQTYIILFFIALSLIALVGDLFFFSIFKKDDAAPSRMSKADVAHRFVIALPMFIILFGNGSSTTTRGQDMFGSWVSMGTNLADALVNHVHVANARYSIKQISSPTGVTANQISQKVREAVIADEKAKMNQQILERCSQTWRTDELKKFTKVPHSVFAVTPAQLNKSPLDFEQMFIKNKQPYTDEEVDQQAPTTWFDIETCASAEKAYKAYTLDQVKRAAYFKSITDFNPEKVRYAVSTAMTKNITMGWTSIALLPAQQALENQTNSLNKELDKGMLSNGFKNSDFKGIDYDFTNAPADVRTITQLATETGKYSLTGTIEAMTQRAAFLFVPQTPGLYETFKSVIYASAEMATAAPEIAASGTEAAASSGWVSKIPVVGELVTGGAAVVLKALDIGKDVIASFGAYYIATEAAKIMIESIVYIVPMLVAGVVIAWWYVEVFAYIIMIPFMAAYVVSDSAREKLAAFFVKGTGLAFKPMLIVIGVFLAVKASALLETMTSGMISTQELAMVAQANTQLDNTSWHLFSSPLSGWGEWLGSIIKAGLIQGALFIALAIVKVFFMSAIIVKFPGFALSLLDVNVDAGSGDTSASKISSLTKGI